ncbi:MAG TPA: hypothetical protein VMG61_17100 [Usitatibacter sp.]|nr:hypothetical protein [Usitatibacter sp.]
MRRSILITALTATLSLSAAAANDGVELRTKALASASASSVFASNYVKAETPNFGRDPMSVLVHVETPAGSTGPQSGCAATGSAVCFDASDGRIVYRGAREFMPKMNGFRAESLSIRHNAVIFKYSFE